MRKPYSPEIEQQVIEKYLSGESVREINERLREVDDDLSDRELSLAIDISLDGRV